MKILRFGIVLLLSVALWGCGKGNSSAPAAIDPTTGKHVTSGWAIADVTTGIPTHASAVNGYFAQPNSCKECHGEKLDGGTSKVSCSNPGRNGLACHAKFPHIEGYAGWLEHGPSAKMAEVGTNGMAHCKKCHGDTYSGKGEAKSCIGCHNLYNSANHAPHAANWFKGNANGLKHSKGMSVTNATACAQCHSGGKNTPTTHKEHTPPAEQPGCYNNTLCHGPAGHTAYNPIGTHRADALADVTCGIVCHASPATATSNPRFNLPFATSTGLNMDFGCESSGCHINAGLAHPYMWLTGRGMTGGVTNSGTHALATVNVTACRNCHNGIELGPTQSASARFGVPSCMPGVSVGGTVCHFSTPVATSSGISTGCKSCHAYLPNGPDGSTTPNRNGKHSAHLSKITGLTCADCHGVYGSPRTDHATRATAQLSIATEFTDSVIPYASPTCSAVSCHGGQSVAWTDSIIVNDPTGVNCLKCHVVRNPAVSYIDVFNGDNTTATTDLHYLHTSTDFFAQAKCTDCHNLSRLQLVHFANLKPAGKAKTFSPGSAAFTLHSSADGKGLTTYDFNSKGACTADFCHGTSVKNWFK